MADELRNYPPPQAEVNTARDVTSPASPAPSAAPIDRGDGSVDVEFRDIVEGGPPGGSRLLGMAKAVWNQAIMPALEKLIPQGAAEIAQALNTGSAYVPYGPTEKPVSMESAGIHGPEVPSAATLDAADRATGGYQVFGPAQDVPTQGDYDAMLAETARMTQHYRVEDKGLDR